MKKILALGFAVALAGCADLNHDHAYRQENDQRVDQITALRQTYRQQQLDHAYDVIRAKLTLSEEFDKHGTPCGGRISNSAPTADEQVALRRWIAQRGEFLTKLETLAKPVTYMPPRVKNLAENFDRMKFEEEAKITAKLDDLSQGRITYCQFAEANKAIDLEANKIAQGFRNQLSEERDLMFKDRFGFPSVSLVYTMP